MDSSFWFDTINLGYIEGSHRVASLIQARPRTFVEIDYEIISTVIFSSLPLNNSRRVVVSYKRKYVHEVLVNCLFKLVLEKVWLCELTVPP